MSGARAAGTVADSAQGPFMILSHHRSGSNFLTDLMQANEGVECISEPLSMHTDFRRFDLQLWTGEEFVPSHFHAHLHDAPGTAAFIRRLRDWLYDAPATMVRGMKETLLFDKLTWCRELLPTIKVVWLVRDPRAVVNSVLRCGLWRFWQYPERVARFCREYYGDLTIDPVSPAELTLWSWKVRYALAREHLGHFDHLCVRLEDLVKAPRDELGRIADLVGFGVTPSQELYVSRPNEESRGGTFSTVRRGTEVVDGWMNELSDEDRLYVERLASEEMSSLGYG